MTNSEQDQLSKSFDPVPGIVDSRTFLIWAGASQTTLAIVFTDIVGSTRLANEVGDEEMQRLRRAHFIQARRLIKENEGFEISTQGDGFLVAFRAAAKALDFSCALQSNTGDSRIAIRAGIHVGPIYVEEENAFSLTVNYASRVASQSKEPELWISNEVYRHINQIRSARHATLRWSEHIGCHLNGFPGKHRLWSTTAGKDQRDTSQSGSEIIVPSKTRCRLAFASRRIDNWEIYVMDEDGTNPKRLTYFSEGSTAPIPPQSNQPVWSPDGSTLAFTTNVNGNSDIYTMDENGGNQSRVTSHQNGSHQPAWGYNGMKIAFVRGGGPHGEIYVMDSDGRNVVRLTNDTRQNEHPTWSPDGTKLAFHSVGEGGNFQIHTIGHDGAGRENITDTTTNSVHPAWSPNGKMIAFTSWDSLGSGGLFVMSLENRERALVTGMTGCDYSAWSPDGKRIAFVVGAGINADVYTVNVDGTDLNRLTMDSGGNIDPAWRE